MNSRNSDYYSHYDEDDLDRWRHALIEEEEKYEKFDFGIDPSLDLTDSKEELRIRIEELKYKIEKLTQIIEERKKQH